MRTAARVSFGVKSRSRPAIAKLAARRFRSHSQGPGRVSSKSLTSKHQTAVGGGEDAEVREVGVAAGLDLQPGLGGLREVHRHDRRRAAIEGERRGEHPPVADRDELLDAALGLVLEQLDRIFPARRRLPFAVARARNPLPRRLAGGGALLWRGRVDKPGLRGGGGHIHIFLGFGATWGLVLVQLTFVPRRSPACEEGHDRGAGLVPTQEVSLRARMRDEIVRWTRDLDGSNARALEGELRWA